MGARVDSTYQFLDSRVVARFERLLDLDVVLSVAFDRLDIFLLLILLLLLATAQVADEGP